MSSLPSILDDTDPLPGLVAAVTPVDTGARAAAEARLATLAVPPGSLGGVGALAVRLAGITSTCPPPEPRRGLLVVAAGDHGVHGRGVTPWPQSLSAALAGTLARGRGAASVLAAGADVDVAVLDVGLATEVPSDTRLSRLHRRRVRAGTRDLVDEDAMAPDEVAEAVRAGAAIVHGAVDDGTGGILLGDVGLANTTPSALLVAALTGHGAAEVTGRGSGIDDAMLDTKRRTIVAALDRHRRQHGDDADAWSVLGSLGGFEHAALVGAMLAAAARHVPVVLDGLISGAAALVAAHACPAVVDHLVAGHCSTEPAATLALDHLGLAPLLALDLRVGEGTGAVLAWPLLVQAATVLTHAATLDDLGLSP